jgi:hypothetical protein
MKQLASCFEQLKKDSLELTVSEKIWLIIIEIVALLSEILNLETKTLMKKLFSENEQFTKYLNLKPLLQAG